MATYEAVEAVSFPIGGAILKDIFVVINTSGQVVAAANGAAAIGVTLEAVTAAQYDSGDGQVTVPVALIQKGGKCAVQMTATSAIAVGDLVASDTAGTAIEAATADTILGVCLEAAGVDADQEVITILFHSPGVVV